jgi:hypothetical protein
MNGIRFSLRRLLKGVFAAAVIFGLWHYHSLLATGGLAIIAHFVLLRLAARYDLLEIPQRTYAVVAILATLPLVPIIWLISLLAVNGAAIENDWPGTIQLLAWAATFALANASLVLLLFMKRLQYVVFTAAISLAAYAAVLVFFLCSAKSNQLLTAPWSHIDLDRLLAFWAPSQLAAISIAWTAALIIPVAQPPDAPQAPSPRRQIHDGPGRIHQPPS